MSDEKTQVNVSADIPPPKKEEPKKIPGTEVEIHPNTTDTGAGDKDKGGNVNVVVDPNAPKQPAKPEVKVVVDPKTQGPGQQQAGASVEVQQPEGGEKPKVQVNVEPPAREPGPGQAATDTETF